MPQKELLTIEFRYNDKPIEYQGSTHRTKTITIGVFDTLREAVNAGNEALKVLSKHFEVRIDDCFKIHGLFGLPKRLVSNNCYSTKGITYFAKITPLNFNPLSEAISEVFEATNNYIQYRKELQDEKY